MDHFCSLIVRRNPVRWYSNLSDLVDYVADGSKYPEEL